MQIQWQMHMHFGHSRRVIIQKHYSQLLEPSSPGRTARIEGQQKKNREEKWTVARNIISSPSNVAGFEGKMGGDVAKHKKWTPNKVSK